MIERGSLHSPLFVNTAGHLSGALLFGVLIVLLIKGWARSRDRQRSAALIAALLAFLWNIGSLVGLASAQRDGQVPDWLVAISFSFLSLLPPVLFRIVLRNKQMPLVWAGYLLGAASALLHFLEIPYSLPALHEAALLLVAIGFALLIGLTFVLSYFQSDARVSLTDALCLLLFTTSFLHFGFGHTNEAWTNEITWHHAGIPLALIVLLRDYRVLFLEAFVRFVANFGLTGFYGFLLYWANKSGNLIERARANAFILGVLLVSFCLSLLLFAYLRTLVQRQLTRRVFRRSDLNIHLNRILRIASESVSESELLNRTGIELAAFVGAEHFEITDDSETRSENSSASENRSQDRSSLRDRTMWVELELPLRFSRGDSVRILLGRRTGGGRYLPEDVDALTRMAALATEQVERFRANELQRLAGEAELRALQAQINPHFLFNSLNTLYGIIGREAVEARRFVMNLAELFRYCLQRDRTFIPFGEELSIVQAYLEIESLRFGDRLRTEISAGSGTREVLIPILAVQPLVENAIKHGIARRSVNGEVRISADRSGAFLVIRVEDNGPGFEERSLSAGLGTGLANLRQRLHLCYGAASALSVQSSGDRTVVTLTIPLQSATAVRSAAKGSRSSLDSVRPAVAKAIL